MQRCSVMHGYCRDVEKLGWEREWVDGEGAGRRVGEEEGGKVGAVR